jgi:cob(I)alamin adenosyltransferase
VRQFGTGRFVDLKNPSAEDRRTANEALEFVRGRLKDGDCQMVVLDEVSTAVSFGLIAGSEVLQAVKTRREGVEVVMTGRDAPLEFIEYADYVSVIDSWKHPFDEGLKARKGVEW